MDNILITAIITTHNRLNLLKKAIDSVLKQTYKNMEIIVVNDASTDGTTEYLKCLENNNNNVKHIYISDKESQGGNYARNQGVKAARGRYIAFLDDDDEWLIDKIEKQLKCALQNTECGLVYCGRYVEKNFGKRIPEYPTNIYQGVLDKLCFQGIFCTTSMMFVERKLIIEAGMFDEKLKYWQEYDLCIRLVELTKVAYVNEPLIIYRVITNDKNRLSNHLDGWLKTVDDINRKYEVRTDAIHRCENRKQYNKKRKYLFQLWKITKKPQHFLRYVFNTTKSKQEIYTSINEGWIKRKGE